MPQESDDSLLYGQDFEERIVAIEPLKDRHLNRIFTRNENDEITSRVEKSDLFLYANDKNPILKNIHDNTTHTYRLFGDNHYNTLVTTQNIGLAYKFKKQSDVQFPMVNCQYQIQTGKTLFMGMEFEDQLTMSFDIETLTSDGYEFPNASREGDEITIISIYTNRGDKYVLSQASTPDGESPSQANPESDYEDSTHLPCGSESNLIKEFIKLVHQIDPDVLIGHYFFNFDMPYIEERCQKYGIKFALGRDGSEPYKFETTLKLADRNFDYTNYCFFGRHCIDTMMLAMQADVVKRSFESYSLKYLAREIGVSPDNRTYVEGSAISDAWKNKHDEYTRDDLLRYALDDVIEAMGLYQHFGQATFYSTQFLPMGYQDVFRLGSGVKVEYLFMRRYMEKGYAWAKPEKARSITGGYAFVKEFGFTDEHVVYADVASLYPSLGEKLKIQPSRDELHYYQKLLRVLKAKRYEFKADIKTTDDPKLKDMYKSKDGSVKIILNSMSYGYLSWSGASFNDYDEAERITTAGQKVLKKMITLTEEIGGRAIKGDSVTEDTPIYTMDENGEINIMSIATLHNVVGDKTDDPLRNAGKFENLKTLTRGGWKKIKYTKKHQTDKEIHRVLTRNGLAKVTEDHSLFSDGVEVKPKNLSKGDKIDELPYQNFGTSKNVNADRAWLLGLMAGDGSVSRVKRHNGGYSTNVCVHNSDPFVLVRASQILEDEFGIKNQVNNTMKSSGTNRVTGGYNYRDYLMMKSKLYDHYTGEKKVPKEILNANDEGIEAFLEGYKTADGWEEKNRTDLTTKSYILACGVQYLMNKIGWRDHYRIDIRSDKESIIGMKAYQEAGRSIRTKNGVIRKNEKYNYTKEVYDISTEDGTFVGGCGQVIFHNTDGALFTIPQIFDDADEYCQYLSDCFDEYIEIDNDGEYEGVLIFDKKSYAMLNADGTIIKKGGTIMGRSIEPFGRQMISDCIHHIIEDNKWACLQTYNFYKQMVEGRFLPPDYIGKKGNIKDSLEEYKHKVALGAGNGGRNPASAYELALQSNKDYQVGDSITYYIKEPQKAWLHYYGKKAFVKPKLSNYEKAEFIKNYDFDYEMEYYKNRLQTHMKRFLTVFSKEEFENIYNIKLNSKDRKRLESYGLI